MRTSLLHLRPTIVVLAAPRTLVYLALALLALATLAAPAGAQTRPNIVLVLTDDQRWDTLSVMPTVQAELVNKGVNFTNGFVVNSVCCPSRASILTGQYSHSTGVYTNKGSRGYRAFREDSTIATRLQTVGYRTGYVGKYLNGYLGPHVPPGWNRWVAFEQTRFFNYTLNVDGVTVPYGSDPADYATDVLADEAVSFIEQTPGAFFLVFSPFAPHGPATPAPRHANAFSGLAPWRPPNYDEEDVFDKPEWVRALPRLTPERQAAVDSFRQNQLRSLLAVDDAVAEIVSTLERTGRLGNTLIVFTSDNGIAWGEHRRDRKEDPYEESIRVPLVVRYDPLGVAGRVEPRLALNIDLAPTFAHLAGAPLPLADGQSLLNLLTGAVIPWRTDFLVEHLRSASSRIPTYCGVRTANSLYVAYETGEEELYDLVSDPHELTNLAPNPAARTTLTAARRRLAQLCSPPPPIICTMKGTTRADILYGTSGYEVVCAYDGDDVVSAGAGNDVVFGGRGGDDLDGGLGNDRINGYTGDDIIYGGWGNDVIAGHSGYDIVYGGPENDAVNGDAGNDVVYSGAGNDRISGGDGRDWLYGGPGADTIDGRDGVRDVVRCGSERDMAYTDRFDRVQRGCEVVRRARARR
jgi:N-acetylglucosamine-6-sulfatase